eukprot:2983403-Alexandrium_andersonii.AAC.1
MVGDIGGDDGHAARVHATRVESGRAFMFRVTDLNPSKKHIKRSTVAHGVLAEGSILVTEVE